MAIDSVIRITNYPISPSTEAHNEERNREKRERESSDEHKPKIRKDVIHTGSEQASDPVSDSNCQIIDTAKLVELISRPSMPPMLNKKIISAYIEKSKKIAPSRQIVDVKSR